LIQTKTCIVQIIKERKEEKEEGTKSLNIFFFLLFENYKINEFTNLRIGWRDPLRINIGDGLFQKSENTSLSLSLSGFGRSSVESGYLSKLEVSSGLL